MRLKEILLAPKTIVDKGSWSTGAKMPKTAFPLTKTNNFKVSASYNWRLVRFDCLGERFRLLIIYRIDLHKFAAYLAKECGPAMMMLARYDYHATEPGWHMHAVCDDSKQVAGRQGGLDRRVPGKTKHHRRADFGIADDDGAFAIAVDIFRLAPPFALVVQ